MKNAKEIALSVSVISIVINLALTAFKVIAGIAGNSSAMVSDGIHSASDVVSTIIVIIGVIISEKPNDNAHQYGHERLECVFSLILSILLFGTGAVIGYNGLVSLINGSYKTVATPSTIALIAAIVSIVVKEGMFWFTIKKAKQINSISLKADAWHHRSDALSSIGSLIAIVFTLIFDLPIFDVIASVIICMFILKVAITIFIESINKMVDKSCSPEKIKEMENILLAIDGVIEVDDIKTRMFGNKIFVDIEIGAYENLSLKVAHGIAETAHIEIEKSDENIKHCMVHVNPVHVEENDGDNSLE